MEIYLQLHEDSFNAVAHIKCPYNVKKQISFCLNNDLKILSISSDAAISFRKIEEESLTFRSVSQRIEVSCERPIKQLHISYCGSVQFEPEARKNFNNIITEDIVSLSWYSVWYPQELPFKILNNKVIIGNGAPWFVLKAKYNDENNTWKYSNPLYDPYNIVAYRKNKLHIISNEYMNLYTVEDGKKEILQNFSNIYKDIIKYYNGNLFKK